MRLAHVGRENEWKQRYGWVMTWNVSDLTPERLHDVVEVEKEWKEKEFWVSRYARAVITVSLVDAISSDAIK